MIGEPGYNKMNFIFPCAPIKIQVASVLCQWHSTGDFAANVRPSGIFAANCSHTPTSLSVKLARVFAGEDAAWGVRRVTPRTLDAKRFAVFVIGAADAHPGRNGVHVGAKGMRSVGL